MKAARVCGFALILWPATVAAQDAVPLNYIVHASGRWSINKQPAAPISEFEPVRPSMVIEHDPASGSASDSLVLRLNGRLLVVSCVRGDCARPVTIPPPVGRLGGSLTVRRARKGADSSIVLSWIRHHASLAAEFRINDGVVALKDGTSDIGSLLETAAPRGLVVVLCRESQSACMPDSDFALIAPLEGRSGIVHGATPGLYAAHVFRRRVTTEGERYESTALRPAMVMLANEARSKEIRRELDELYGVVSRWRDPALPLELAILPRRLLFAIDPQ